ncbi:hypothetical protein Tco_0746775 [Tanacetum coccineum]
MRNTLGKEQISKDMDMPAFDAALRAYCDRNYHQLLPIIAEKVHQEKVQQENLKAVKARLNFEECSQHSESGTPSGRRDLRTRLESRRICSVSGSPEPRHGRPESPRKRDTKRKMVFKRLEKGVFHRLSDKERVGPHSRMTQGISRTTTVAEILRAITKALAQEEQSLLLRNIIKKEHPHTGWKLCQKTKPWVCEETDLFTPRIRYFDLPKRTRMPSHVKTYDGSEDPEDHLKIFQAAAKVERWAMSTWCHMFNSTLIGSARVWFDDLPQESIDSYDDLKEAFLVESRDVKGAPEIMKILGFMHGITNPELIKRLHDKILKSVDEMMRITMSFLRGRWQLVTKNERSHFRHENSRRPDISRISRKEVLKISKEELLKNWKLSHVIKELKQNSGKDQPKENKKEETSSKDKALAILMVQPWQRVARQRFTQSFSSDPEISFLPLKEEEGTEGPMITEAEIGGHFIHRMYMDDRSALEIL